MEGKKWYLSRTLWVNLVMGVLVYVVPGLKEYVTEEMLATAFAGINIVLRLVTKEKLQIG